MGFIEVKKIEDVKRSYPIEKPLLDFFKETAKTKESKTYKQATIEAIEIWLKEQRK